MRQLHGGNDEYYTDDVVADCLTRITINDLLPQEVGLFIEPSAGSGAFVKSLLKYHLPVVAYDINPQHSEVVKLDFLDELFPSRFTDKLTVTLGNPPFGFASNKAVKFFNKCADFSDYICFIVPLTFRKLSIQNKLNRDFHLYKEYPVPKNSFILNGSKHDVPCVFQIWKKENTQREIISGDLSKYLKQVKPADADFAMRRVGGKAGEILNGFDYSPSSTYFFKEIKKGTLNKLKKANFDVVRNNTVGIRSISQLEILRYLESA